MNNVCLTERSSIEPHKFELGYAARSPDDGQKFDGFDIVPNLNNNKPSRVLSVYLCRSRRGKRAKIKLLSLDIYPAYRK